MCTGVVLCVCVCTHRQSRSVLGRRSRREECAPVASPSSWLSLLSVCLFPSTRRRRKERNAPDAGKKEMLASSAQLICPTNRTPPYGHLFRTSRVRCQYKRSPRGPLICPSRPRRSSKRSDRRLRAFRAPRHRNAGQTLMAHAPVRQTEARRAQPPSREQTPYLARSRNPVLQRGGGQEESACRVSSADARLCVGCSEGALCDPTGRGAVPGRCPVWSPLLIPPEVLGARLWRLRSQGGELIPLVTNSQGQ